MREDWFKEILKTINNFKEYVPSGNKLLDNLENMNIDQLYSTLNQLFVEEEAAIEREKSKSYVTDTYENNVRFFARELIVSMIPGHSDLKDNKEYRKLLKQRHIAYGFYCAFNRILEHGHEVLEDSELKKDLYLGLVEFYEKFFGKFSDNEEAIKLLCGFYPNDINLTEQQDLIAKVLYKHITYAGAPSNFGYAYNGIDLIRKHIGNLPLRIIDRLLRRYELYKIINEKVSRHQIFTIIDNIHITKEEKSKYKFSYIDSLILANVMNRNLYEKYIVHDPESYNRYYTQLHSDLSDEKLGLISNTDTNTIVGYWTNECSVERHFILNEKVLLDMRLDMDKERVCIKYIDRPTINAEFIFNYTDWMLDDYHSKESNQTLHDFVFESNGEVGIVYRHLTFSLLYLNEFRGLSEQLVNFDHQFTYDSTLKELGTTVRSSDLPHFYGSKIYSLSCIVGKNGTGKTSTVDFLRGTFFRLLRLIGENQIPIENGYVNEINYGAYRILDEGCTFFVAFYLDSEPYYLTNIEGVTVTIAKPFDHNTYNSVNELSKIVYFSNKLSINQDSLYTDDEVPSRQMEEVKEKLANSLKSFRQVDYSEESSFMQKRKSMELARNNDMDTTIVNRDLCYQLTFLHNFLKGERANLFDMPIDKVFNVKSISVAIEEVTTSDLADMFDGKHTKLDQFLTVADAKLEYFSSGQYAKFSFLAKLYWFLDGYRTYHKIFESLVGKNEFSQSEALLEGETALLFIDEGELYYHPEWQRSYIKTLIDMINNAASEEAKLQVVITTNSPFIISDILKEDITYLSSEHKEFDRTFGQNIHKLLKDNFFMEYTIGEYSRKMIEDIMGWLCGDKKEPEIKEELSHYFGNSIEPKEYYEKIRCLIDKIGEPVYREKLFDMLNKSKFSIVSRRGELLRQMANIERSLQELGED